MSDDNTIDPLLVASVKQQESGGNPNAVSSKGAVGTMQTLPTTLTNPGYGVTPAKDNSDAERQRVGEDYLQAMHNKYNDRNLALAAYNWGPRNVDNWIANGQNPADMPAETKNYVQKVNQNYQQLKAKQLPAGTQMASNDTYANDAMTSDSSDPLSTALNAELKSRESTASIPSVSNNSPMTFAAAKPDALKVTITKDQTSSGDPLSDALNAELTRRKNSPPLPAAQANAQQDSPIAGALSDIGRNSVESFRNALTQTGQAMSEPLNNPGLSNWAQHPIMGPLDATVRRVGRVGNALSGTFGAVTSPLQGALTASIENSGVIPAFAQLVKNNLVPDDQRFTANISPDKQHELASGIGSDLTNSVMMGKAGIAGQNLLRAQQGLPPLPPPANPLLNFEAASKRLPGFLGDTSSGAPSTIATVPTEQLKTLATNFYDSSDAKGGLLKPDTVNGLVEKATSDAGYQTPEGRAFAGDNLATKALDKLQLLKDKPLSLKGLQEIDDSISDDIQSSYRSGNDAVATKLIKIRDTLRDGSRNAAAGDMQNPNGFSDWQTGDKLWSTYRASKAIDDILSNAMSADVPSTAIKNGFKAFVKNKNNLAPFNAEEIAALKNAARTGLITGALKTFGSKIISGVVGGTAGAAGGGLFGGLVGAGTGEAVGYPFRSAATALQKNKANYVKNLLSQRPVVQSALSTGPIPLAKPPSAVQNPLLMLPAPELTNVVNTYGQVVPLTKSGREIIGQSPSTKSEQIPAERAASNDISSRGVNKTMKELGQQRVLEYINKLQQP